MANESSPGQSGPGGEELVEFGPPAGRPAGGGSARRRIALGAVGLLAVCAAGGLLLKYAFAGPGGPSHEVVAPRAVDGYTRSANLEKQLNIAGEARQVAAESSGKASGVASAVYQAGSAAPAVPELFEFVGGKLADANPGASMAHFKQAYPGAVPEPPGTLGGQVACAGTQPAGQGASMCVWYDGDTFGTLVSPTMPVARLAKTMEAARPRLEVDAK